MIYDLSVSTEQEMWIVEADAGYSGSSIIDSITHLEVVPIVDLNPKNSTRLKALKKASNDLKKYSKKAVMEGLSKSERRAWVEEIKSISEQSPHPFTYDEKCEILRKVMRKYTEKAKRYGLSYNEQRTEKKLRKLVMDLRRELRLYGTSDEKKKGLLLFAFGTIEWQLIYAIRGQNEGINGIVKKRGNVIGDGQDTSWIQRDKSVKNRLNACITLMKARSLVYFLVTGQTTHSLRVYYNWHIKNKSFLLMFIVIFCR